MAYLRKHRDKWQKNFDKKFVKKLNNIFKTNIRTHMVPTNADQVLKRIMTDMSTHLRRSKETYAINNELPKFPMVDYEEMRRIVQSNFQYLGVQIRKWKRDNT